MQTNDTQLTQLLNLSAQIAQRQPEAIALLNQVYTHLFGDTIQQGCGNCYQKAFYRIQKYLYLQQQNDPQNNTIMPHTDRKYLLKPDRILQTVFGGDSITNDNLTDDIAEGLLSQFPTLLKHFEKYPAVQKVANVVKDAADVVEKGAAIASAITDAEKPAKKAAEPKA